MANQALLIVNPFSGKKNASTLVGYIEEKLKEKGYSSSTFISSSVNELAKFVQNNTLQDYSLIGLLGGDGTMHEFINAALNKHAVLDVPLALFPCGTGNAFNFDIGCASVDETLQCIFNNTKSYIDVAEVNFKDQSLWSFNIIGCGLVADINKLAENMRWMGAARYTTASVIKLLSNPETEMTIETEHGKLEGKFSFVLACNTRYTGKGMLMAPHAALNDGKFDVIIVKSCGAIKLLKLFPKIFKGAHLNADVLTYLQCKQVSITTHQADITNIDGEMKGSTPFSFKVHAAKICVFTKPTG